MGQQPDPTASAAEPTIEPAASIAIPDEAGGQADEAPATLAVDAVDPTESGDLDLATIELLAGGATALAAPATAQLITTALSGTYRSTGTPFQVELRVDIDGKRPLRRLSADYFQVSGATVSYVGSMRVDAITVTTSPTAVTITGLGVYTFAVTSPRVRVTIPRTPTPPTTATLQHIQPSGALGPVYVCKRQSAMFRRLLFEQDRQDNVPAIFSSYSTGSLPSGGPARTLTIAGAYAEAGVEMQTSGVTDVVATSETANGTWSDAELHAAMVRHFSLWKNLPQWAIWLLHARLHDLGPRLLGIMFDQSGAQRQGAAVFYAGLAGTTAGKVRQQLYACTHELGHAFNLLHSWQKSYATPPAPNRPNSLSWMNYPQDFPAGETTFWNSFNFQFDDHELLHIRHGFRNSVIMGGSAFASGAALTDDDAWRAPVEDRSGLKLELSVPAGLRLGAPVCVDLRLSATDCRGVPVYQTLRPRTGTVEIAIARPNGNVVAYRPLIHHCIADAGTVLDTEIQETAFIGYGRDGLYFGEPGLYGLRARYTAPDGSTIVSDTARLRVRAPINEADEAVAELMVGDQQGTLMYVVGSDAQELQAGNDALRTVVEQYPEHPLADVARVVLGTNAKREFKQVEADNTVTVRAPQAEEGDALLAGVVGEDPRPAALRALAAETHADLGGYLAARRREIAVEAAPESD